MSEPTDSCKKADEKLKRFEWMLSGKAVSDREFQSGKHDRGYGNLAELNRDGLILKSIGIECLESFANDYLELLKTSSAIYEANGNYAFGIFSSGWCRMMDGASRNLCDTPDNAEALNSGRWLCHESCWTDCGKRVVAECEPVDIACHGGIRIYAVPILANGKVVGTINLGYGDPPADPGKLRKIAEAYHLDYDDLVFEAKAYNSRPPFLVDLAKKRLLATARLIGAMIEKKQVEEVLRESREKFAAQLSNMPGMAYRCENNADWTMLFVSEGCLSLTGYRAGELTGKPGIPYERIIHPDDRRYVREQVEAPLRTGDRFEVEYRIIAKDGTEKWVLERGSEPPGNPGEHRLIEGFISDITYRKRMENDLRRDREHMDHILRVTRTNMNTLDSGYNLRQVDAVWRKIYGDPQGRKCHEYFMGLDKPCAGCGLPQALETGKTTVTEEFLPKENRYIEVHTIPFQDENGEWLVTEFNIDITERKRAEAEKEKLQSQLLQAQKMEAVGKLAGGTAHDFNNMLSVILGHVEMALEQIDPGQPLFDDLQEVRKAAERSANLTRQLLAFARKQIIAPRIIDLNETVEGILKMLRRLIGEDIDLAWLPGKNLAPVKVDPSQIDQMLANLCVNARDAITDVGKITIETNAVSFDEAYCAVHAGFVPGEYVLLAVSDNGCGMDPEIVSHLFEPFFTTKEQGKGTGLGLSSVYGAVKQNNGVINVYSEPGLGTTFKIYLPRNLAGTPLQADKATAKPTAEGSETILLVEDEPAILHLATMMLEKQGYDVVAAKTPGEAIRLAHEHGGHIDLLMTDVVMPEMNGRDLAKKLLSIYPDIKRLFMSGYTASVIAHHGVLDEGVYFIQKPFSSKDLGTKLCEVFQ